MHAGEASRRSLASFRKYACRGEDFLLLILANAVYSDNKTRHRNRNNKKDAAAKCNKISFFAFIFRLQEDQDWGFVAMVLDRLFLWIFTTVSLFGTFSILCEAPAL